MVDGFPADATGFLILFARLGAMLMLLPACSEESVLPRIRLLLALGLTAGLWGLLSPQVASVTAKPAALPGIIIAEMMIGLMMGMIIRMLFQAAAMAGSIISLQVGLSSALVFDPSQGSQAALISRFMSVAAVVTCMALGVHHLWLQSMMGSYAVFPIGGLPPWGDFAQLGVMAAGKAMSLALSLAAPLVVYGIVFNVGLGLIARLTPAIQIFFIAQPLNLLLGLGFFAVMIGAMLTAFAEAMAELAQTAWV